MKYYLILPGFLLMLGLVSCFHDEDSSGYCYQVIHDSPDSVMVTNGEMAVIRSLFESNDLDIRNYQIYSVLLDESGNSH